MKIGILVPLSQELDSLTKTKAEPGDCISLSENITVCLSGVGPKQTKIGFEKLLKYRVDVVVSWGSAAGLSPQVAAGDLLIPQSVKVGNSMIGTYNNFNQKLITRLPPGVTLHRNSVTESPVILRTINDKEKMYHATGCIAADMESGTLAQMADLKKVPFAVVRSVSDEANMPLPVALLNSFPQGTFHLPAFLRSALLNPVEWPQITKLMLNFNKVRKTLIIASEIIKKYSNTWM